MVEVYELLTVVVSLIVVKLFHWIYQWRNPTSNGKLPPGSMGYPIIGETFEFMKPHDVLQFPTFVKERVLRYGPVFRTSLFGAKAIISMDLEMNVEIAKANHVPGVTKSIARLFGKNNLFIQSKQSHKHVRNLTFQLLGPQCLKLRMVEEVDLLARTYMEEGARNGCLDVKETSSKILIECLAKKVMGEMEPEAAKELALCWRYFPRDWFQFSWNVPGAGVYRMMKARKRMMKLIKEMLTKQHQSPGILAATVKLISDHPKVVEELNKEHEGIVRGKTEKEAGLTWEDYKSMTFTHKVINESLRITSTAPTVLRITDHDFQVGDYTIPAGWIFMGYPNVHFSPKKYDDPLVFNPWRWKREDLSSILSKTYIPFGAGSRLCVGAEFAKLQMAIFIHHMFRYRFIFITY
ncbi:unnamed protein product [Arabidopsis lyrata]|nr:unnamed protein product [Arabidopsis lyrata]